MIQAPLFLVAAMLAAYFVYSPRRLAFLAVVAMFVTRPAVDVGGLNVRLELVVGVLVLLRLVHEILSRQSRRLTASMSWSVVAIVSWLLFATVTSINIAPIPSRSISVLVWCLLNVITAFWISKSPNVWSVILRWGCRAALVCCFAALAFWAAATSGLFAYGVQIDPTYGGFAAYVFSIEANILAGLLCLWALVGIVNPMSAVPRHTRVTLAFVAPVAILTTHTRAALIAYLAGLVFCIIFRPTSRKIAVSSLAIGGVIMLSIMFTAGDAGFSKFLSVLDFDGGTGGLRYRTNEVAVNEWWTSPERWIGLGWNSFGQRHIDETQPRLMLPGYIGNLPLQIAYDSGLLGVFWVALAAGIVLIGVRRIGRVDLLLVLFVPYMIFSIATSSLWLLETWVLVGLVWGMCSQHHLSVSNNLDPGFESPPRLRTVDASV